MSNYYKNNIPLSNICKGILSSNTTILDISNNFFKNLGLSLTNTTFTDTINEKPNNLGYLYNGTDI